MTQTKKVMITAILAVFLLFAGGIGIVSAEDAAQFLSGNDYNIKASDANSSVWYYDSATGYLWTGPDTGLTSLPVYLKALGANTIYGYTFLVVDPDHKLFGTPGEFSLVPTVYTQANTIIDSSYDNGIAGISASVSLGNSTTIGPDYSNIVNVSFRSPQTIDSSYRFYFDYDSVAVSAIDIDNVTIMDITSSENIPGSYPAGIIFYVRNIPSLDKFTLSDAENRNATNAGTVYYYQERDGTANLTALITNVTSTDAYTWYKKSADGDLALTFTNKTASLDNFTTLSLAANDEGDDKEGKYANTEIEFTMNATRGVTTVNVNATYWNQSVQLEEPEEPDDWMADVGYVGQYISLDYVVAAVPADYVAGENGSWNTSVPLYPIGSAGYQNYTVSGNASNYYIANTSETNDGDIKYLQVTASSYTGNEGPISLYLTTGKVGDPNEDDTVDIVDGAIVGIQTLRSEGDDILLMTSQQKFLADTNQDGVVNVADVLTIHEFIITFSDYDMTNNRG